MATTADWPSDMDWASTLEDVEHERRYWEAMDTSAEYDACIEAQAALESFESWALSDLVGELEVVRTLTPDQTDVIEEMVAEIQRRGVAA
jgi:hypothetical protein